MPLSPQLSFINASLLVALGGGVGSWLRFVVGRAWTAAAGPARATAFPFATLTVNVAGSMAMGLLVGWLARAGGPNEATRLLFAVGLLGGFTTFSSFSLEVITLFERGEPGLASIYAAASLAGGLIGLWLGLLLMRSPA